MTFLSKIEGIRRRGMIRNIDITKNQIIKPVEIVKDGKQLG